jgi:hypothetical protein
MSPPNPAEACDAVDQQLGFDFSRPMAPVT